jgi:hypothetical protein
MLAKTPAWLEWTSAFMSTMPRGPRGITAARQFLVFPPSVCGTIRLLEGLGHDAGWTALAAASWTERSIKEVPLC